MVRPRKKYRGRNPIKETYLIRRNKERKHLQEQPQDPPQEPPEQGREPRRKLPALPDFLEEGDPRMKWIRVPDGGPFDTLPTFSRRSNGRRRSNRPERANEPEVAREPEEARMPDRRPPEGPRHYRSRNGQFPVRDHHKVEKHPTEAVRDLPILQITPPHSSSEPGIGAAYPSDEKGKQPVTPETTHQSPRPAKQQVQPVAWSPKAGTDRLEVPQAKKYRVPLDSGSRERQVTSDTKSDRGSMSSEARMARLKISEPKRDRETMSPEVRIERQVTSGTRGDIGSMSSAGRSERQGTSEAIRKRKPAETGPGRTEPGNWGFGPDQGGSEPGTMTWADRSQRPRR